ncbi:MULTISPECIES: YqeG family HAD IIIA-type phosphatase [Enterococcus]|uniref:YqeG family HAD IIIA-type phosphatase n=1 Tax=Enterococcus TaxID=1350 RepID=UPI000D356BB6|nr:MULTISPECIES: YqeG family HAD IIIA-type phosphatase [Enterococcus]EGO2728437.1 YqeG family HAD IIIA-type phosphatase [Enterococcus faecalis]EGO7661941.1 YqeG family HAD IIIA-type phosphatase [Enterococcus faecalis]EMC0710569.1 YqeG family HAD IIIA-type phosphatase [Enterococcus faecalis]MDB1568544.1 YqeG family HAD IIIA-type phosphatase [Enterococcus faecalis]MDB1571243.1 YqeG family HAD IIIA-type phosphatase [Enterococcus faecalis]
MFLKYKPTWMIDAIYKITPAQLKKLGIKAVLTDLDNTLIAWNNPDGTEELKTWLLEMKNAGITVLVVSNNKDSRIKRVVEKFDLDYVARALKPTARGFKLAEKKLGLKPSEMLMVGDQIMTDIRGANAAGIRNVLVQPIVDTDGWNTRINRFFERKIMKYLSKKHPEMTWRGGLE